MITIEADNPWDAMGEVIDALSGRRAPTLDDNSLWPNWGDMSVDLDGSGNVKVVIPFADASDTLEVLTNTPPDIMNQFNVEALTATLPFHRTLQLQGSGAPIATTGNPVTGFAQLLGDYFNIFTDPASALAGWTNSNLLLETWNNPGEGWTQEFAMVWATNKPAAISNYNWFRCPVAINWRHSAAGTYNLLPIPHPLQWQVSQLLYQTEGTDMVEPLKMMVNAMVVYTGQTMRLWRGRTARMGKAVPVDVVIPDSNGLLEREVERLAAILERLGRSCVYEIDENGSVDITTGITRGPGGLFG